MTQRAFSIKTWLLGQFLLVVLVAAVVATFLVVYWRLPLVRAQNELEQVRVADVAQYQVEINLDLAERQAASLAAMVGLDGPAQRVRQQLFQSLRGLRADAGSEFFQGIYVLDGAFKLVDMVTRLPAVDTDQKWLGNDFSGLRVLKAIAATEQFTWSDRYDSPVLGVPVVALAVPAGRGYLLVELSVDRLAQSATHAVALEGLMVLVMDSRGELIAAPDGAPTSYRSNLARWPVVAEALGGVYVHGAIEVAGQVFDGTTRRLSRLGWMVFAGYPQDVAMASRNAAIGITLTTVLLAVGVGLVLFIQFANLVKRRMARSARYAEAVAGGIYDLPPAHKGMLELDQLDARLGQMALTIERREKQLRSIVDTTPTLAIQWFDRDGRVVDWNPASQAVLGWSKAEAVGKKLDELIYTPEQQAAFEQVLAEIADTGQPFGPYSGEVRDRSGQRKVILSTTFAVPDLAGGQLFVCMDVDITDLKRNEEAIRASEQKFNLFFEASPVAVAVLERVGSVLVHVDVNRSWERLLGRTKAAVAGEAQPIGALLKDPVRDGFWVNGLAKGGTSQQWKAWLVRGNGEAFLGEGVAAPLSMGGREWVICSLHDVTAQWQMDQALRELNAQLEERIAKRTETLTQTNQELAQALRHLQDTHERLVQADKLASLGALVAGVAHELNTPIGNGLMAVSTLSQRAERFRALLTGGLKRSDLDRFVTQVETAADISTRNLGRASELISSFKQVAVDQTSSQRRVFDLAEVVHEIVLTLQPTLKHTTHQVVTDVPSGLALDSYPGPLGQVIANLVQNAVVHAFGERDAGTVRISAHTDDGQLHLCVADDGMGIPVENLGKVFDPFFTTRLGQGGSGLGLHIVHNVVTGLLGGHIAVACPTGGGTAMHIRIPLSAPTGAQS
jgi:PAS domain S-box-containing protein